MAKQSRHECDQYCKAWHEKHPMRGQKPNSIPAGDPRHLNERMKEAKRRNKK